MRSRQGDLRHGQPDAVQCPAQQVYLFALTREFYFEFKTPYSGFMDAYMRGFPLTGKVVKKALWP